MIAVANRLPVREGAADRIVEMFSSGRGAVQEFPGFVAMEVLKAEDASEVLVVTWWEDRASFDAWVGSDAFKRAHGRGGGGELLRGHPQMTVYEVALERDRRRVP
ncbi:hypothetical protein RxyAA322_05430 [Rubrobacter xylanophilus]|uniref:ABM domain-containing protein n=1 Tax=Rubrobacter xylanophilus TaxID=49319 RepID=A0A510HFH4_9ACTN|nr:antibiotic biosynthesis monooxygenase [Rubrobacter xylanophilus]BBL78689.1 hypothetical protein RxyAA322_05430 [Rubrobacter xylanophilus]